jgi:hypothetical protein
MPGAESYSHRDRRAHRAVDRAVGAMVGGITALVVLAVVGPWWWLSLAAVLAMLALGGGYVLWGNRLWEEYSRDLRAALEESGDLGFLRAEVGSSFPLSPPPIGVPSPHRRRPRPVADGPESESPNDPATRSASTPDRPEDGP